MKYIKKMVKKSWVLTPVILYAIIYINDILLENHNLVLRSKPSTWIFLLWALSVFITVLCIGISLYRMSVRRKKLAIRIAVIIVDLCLLLGCFAFEGLCFLADAFGSQREHVVERDNRKLIACVDSFTDVKVYYYEYKGDLVRGTELIGEEWYGSGGYDPFTCGWKAEPKRSTFYK